ncbi:Smr/MutS family protein [Algibacter sp. 2305UL17-15]|uniref:Smr/MutS family protein n=1 Tax=Algibacter sp. 2305UL17-15 TaxID=3231268 RepID=UPI00345B35B4
MRFKIGNRVAVLDEELSGVVKQIDETTVTLETEDGFLLDFEAHELVLLDTDNDLDAAVFSNSNVNEVLSEKEGGKRKSHKRVKPKERSQPAMEVDLHINQLVRSSRGMTNFDMLNLQMQTAKRQLEFAISKRIQRIVFIHGVGEGVLKAELESLFGRYDNLKYYDANYQKYGLGATEVYFYQNKA